MEPGAVPWEAPISHQSSPPGARRPSAPAARRRRTDSPSGPPNSAPGGSKSLTAGGRQGHSPSETYGGFETTTSKRPPHFKAEYASQRTKSTREATPRRSAFPRAARRAPAETSVATTRAHGTSAARVTAIAPLPVPTSSASEGAGPFRRRTAIARSASPSVSGRGIRVSRFNRNSLPQKSHAPRTYWSGSPAALRARRVPRRSAASPVSSSPRRNSRPWGMPVTRETRISASEGETSGTRANSRRQCARSRESRTATSGGLRPGPGPSGRR